LYWSPQTARFAGEFGFHTWRRWSTWRPVSSSALRAASRHPRQIADKYDKSLIRGIKGLRS
jgi:hypothetical protein